MNRSTHDDDGALLIGHSKDASLHTFEVHLSKFNVMKTSSSKENEIVGTFYADRHDHQQTIFSLLLLFLCRCVSEVREREGDLG